MSIGRCRGFLSTDMVSCLPLLPLPTWWTSTDVSLFPWPPSWAWALTAWYLSDGKLRELGGVVLPDPLDLLISIAGELPGHPSLTAGEAITQKTFKQKTFLRRASDVGNLRCRGWPLYTEEKLEQGRRRIEEEWRTVSSLWEGPSQSIHLLKINVHICCESNLSRVFSPSSGVMILSFRPTGESPLLF